MTRISGLDFSGSVLVIGGGIMGLMSAFRLQNAAPGARIVITEPAGFPAAANASAIAGGMLAPYSEIEYMPDNLLGPALAGLESWAELADSLAQPLGFERRGSFLCAHAEDRHMLMRFTEHLEARALPYKILDTDSLKKLEPALAGRFETALWVEEEAHLNPKLAMKALCEMLASKVIKRADPDSESQSWDWVIDCRGYEAAANDPALRGVKGEIITARNPDISLGRPVRLMHPRYPLYIVPREDHIFTIGATIVETADEQVRLRSAMELMSALYTLHPSFGEAEIIDIKAGIRPAYPDNMPRITIDEARGIIRCNGLFRHGYLLAPAMADCIVDHILERRPKPWRDVLSKSQHSQP